MSNKKNNILAFGNKEFNNSLIELKNHFHFHLEITDELKQHNLKENYQVLLVHEDALKDKNFREILKKESINKIIFHSSKKIGKYENFEKLLLPTSIEQINAIIVNNIIKKEFKTNSSLKINNYILDKNLRRLVNNNIFLELTEKEIKLIELLYKNSFTKKKEILAIIWKYANDADTHTVETHIYRLRKKIKDTFNDEIFIKSEKEGYTV